MSHFLIFLFFSVASASVLHADKSGVVSSAKTTHLHFYLHEFISGSNPTALPVAKGPTRYVKKTGPPYGFGTIVVVDDILTDGPNLTTNIVGRAQGFYSFSGISGNEFLLSLNCVFLGGEFNGSTVTVFGRGNALDPVEELPVIGGSGKFRMARGYSQIKTIYVNLTTGDYGLEIDLYVYGSSMKIDELILSNDGSTSDGNAFSGSIGTDGKNNLNLNIVMIIVVYFSLSKHLIGI